MSIIKIENDDFGIEKSKAEQIKNTFEPMVIMLENFESDYNEIVKLAEKETTIEVVNSAKRLRLDIGQIRIKTEKIRKAEKEEYLRAGKAIDGVSNILKWAIVEKEDKLKEIENYFKILEENRLLDLQNKRAEKLIEYVSDAFERNLSNLQNDEFEALYKMKKQEFEDRIKSEKIAKQDEIKKRKEEIKKQKEMQAENKRLKAEKEQREKEQKEKDEIARKEKERFELAEKEKRAKLELKLKAEKEQREKEQKEAFEKNKKLEAEIKAKKEAEIKAKKEAEIKKENVLKASDTEKVQLLKNDFELLKNKYSFTSKKYIDKYSGVERLINKIIKYID